jgi:hypothetical protein
MTMNAIRRFLAKKTGSITDQKNVLISKELLLKKGVIRY